jgi:hypothetical protein
MRRIIVALTLTCAFAFGLLAGFSSKEAAAFQVCQFAKCVYDDRSGIYIRWSCCQDTSTGQITCSKTTQGCEIYY